MAIKIPLASRYPRRESWSIIETKKESTTERGKQKWEKLKEKGKYREPEWLETDSVLVRGKFEREGGKF